MSFVTSEALSNFMHTESCIAVSMKSKCWVELYCGLDC